MNRPSGGSGDISYGGQSKEIVDPSTQVRNLLEQLKSQGQIQMPHLRNRAGPLLQNLSVSSNVAEIQIIEGTKNHSPASNEEVGYGCPSLHNFRKELDSLNVKKQSIYLNFIDEVSNSKRTLEDSKNLAQRFRETFTRIQVKYLEQYNNQI